MKIEKNFSTTIFSSNNLIYLYKNNEKENKRTLTKKLLDSSCCLCNIFSPQEVKFIFIDKLAFLLLLFINDRALLQTNFDNYIFTQSITER